MQNDPDKCKENGGIYFRYNPPKTEISFSGIKVLNGACKCRFTTSTDSQSVTELFFISIFYVILAWYFGQVFTYDHGRSEPFYFPFLPWYWFPTLRPRTRRTGVVGVATDNDVLNEEREVQNGGRSERPVVISGLAKVFKPILCGKSFTAVNGLSTSMENGKIFALLGHNGAGKTAALKMISGLTSMTASYSTNAVSKNI